MESNQWGGGPFIRAMADLEHDDPEQAPTYQQHKLVKVGYIWMTPETAAELQLDLEPA